MTIMTHSEYYIYETHLNLTENQKSKITDLLILSDGTGTFPNFLVTDKLIRSQGFSCEEYAYQLNNKIDAIVAEDD